MSNKTCSLAIKQKGDQKSLIKKEIKHRPPPPPRSQVGLSSGLPHVIKCLEQNGWNIQINLLQITSELSCCILYWIILNYLSALFTSVRPIPSRYDPT